VHNTVLWFVPCLFMVELIYYWLSRCPKVLTVLISVALPLVNIVMVKTLGTPWEALPFNLDAAFMAVPFFLLGNLLVRNIGHDMIQKTVLEKKWISAVLVLALFALLALFAKDGVKISMGHSNYGESIPLFYLRAMMGIGMMMTLSILLNSKERRNVTKYVRWVGRKSFDFMSLNVPVKGFVIVVIAKMTDIGQMDIWTSVTYSIIPFVITVILVTFITIFVDRYIRNKRTIIFR